MDAEKAPCGEATDAELLRGKLDTPAGCWTRSPRPKNACSPTPAPDPPGLLRLTPSDRVRAARQGQERRVGDGPSERRTLSVAMMGHGRLAGFAVCPGGCAGAVGVIVVASPATKMSRPRSSSAAPS